MVASSRARLGIVLLPLLIWGCSDATGSASAPSALELELPSSTSEGRSFTLRITAIGSTGATPDPLASGSVTLRLSAGTITPATVQMNAGRVDVEVQTSGATGALTLRAEFGAATGTGILRVAAAANRLPGASTAQASTAIPLKVFVPRPEDYTDTHPELTGRFLSFNTIMIVFQPAATVGEVNTILDDLDAEIAGGITGTTTVPGILFLRIASTSHATLGQLLTSLRQHPKVRRVVQDGLLEETLVSAASGITAAGWSWELAPGGGNWGLERTRVPQMWNLNAAIDKAGGPLPVTAVLDVGFESGHPDLVYHADFSGGVRDDHGTHVAGTIGALFDNGGVGVDGVNPFARLVIFTSNTSWAQMNHGYYNLVSSDAAVRVVNLSLGYNWYKSNINSDASVHAQTVATEQGALFWSVQELLAAIGNLPVVVTAAGNDTSKDARYASPMANAAIVHGNANIIVVESVADTPGSAGAATLSNFSNINGHISAPGSGILSTDTLPVAYSVMSGTSMATPHVAGLIGFLYALDRSLPAPTLTANPIRDLILANSVPVAGGGRPRIDAFATAVDIDRVSPGDRILRMLADLDDGTPDGNLRVNADGSVNTTDAKGDGRIDMADFRRWRDWFLSLDRPDEVMLDGSPTHPKKDLNGNGKTAAEGDNEFVYPRLDLNGDGIIALVERSYIGGRFQREVTDLEVLEELFSDPHYSASDLRGLIESGDVHVNAGHCLTQNGVAAVVSSLKLRGTTAVIEERTHSVGDPAHIYTVGADLTAGTGYVLRVDALNASGLVVADAEQDLTLRLGQDIHWQPVCTSSDSGNTASAAVFPRLNRSSDGALVTVRVGSTLLATDGTRRDAEPGNFGTFIGEGTGSLTTASGSGSVVTNDTTVIALEPGTGRLLRISAAGRVTGSVTPGSSSGSVSAGSHAASTLEFNITEPGGAAFEFTYTPCIVAGTVTMQAEFSQQLVIHTVLVPHTTRGTGHCPGTDRVSGRLPQGTYQISVHFSTGIGTATGGEPAQLSAQYQFRLEFSP